MASTAAIKSTENLSRDVPLRSEPNYRGASGTSHVAPDLFNSRNELSRESVGAIAQRRAARLNAANIEEAEVINLKQEHQMLVLKKFDDGFTAADQRRLNFVRWSLDRIQDARHGYALDELENAVEIYEKVGRNVDRLVNQLNNFTHRGQTR